jgi:hypothetical protein
MTVRAKSELHRALSKPGVAAIWARSNTVGELQVQVKDHEGKLTTVFIPSSRGAPEPRFINLLDHAPAAHWRDSKSLLAAVRLGHLHVTLKQKD